MSEKIAVIGLGYVGLPLLYELQKSYVCIGFDIDPNKITALKKGIDITNELGEQKTLEMVRLFTDKSCDLANCTVYIVTVPTPVDHYNIPDLEPLKKVSALIAKYVNQDCLVIYESTVAPGTKPCQAPKTT